MANSGDIADLLNRITTDVRSIVADEVALAKAEIRPTVRRVGVGGGLFGAAGYFAVSATIVLWLTMAAGFAWLYAGAAHLGPWAAVFLGALTAVVVLLVIAGLLALAGKRSFAAIKAPEKTPETLNDAMSALTTGLEEGKRRVDAITSSPTV